MDLKQRHPKMFDVYNDAAYLTVYESNLCMMLPQFYENNNRFNRLYQKKQLTDLGILFFYIGTFDSLAKPWYIGNL